MHMSTHVHRQGIWWKQDPHNEAAWCCRRAKAFVTDTNSGETRMWNVLFADGNTEILVSALTVSAS